MSKPAVCKIHKYITRCGRSAQNRELLAKWWLILQKVGSIWHTVFSDAMFKIILEEHFYFHAPAFSRDLNYKHKLEKKLKGSLDLIPSPSPSVKNSNFGGKVCLRCKGKTLLGIVNKLLKTKSLFTSPSNVLPYYLK